MKNCIPPGCIQKGKGEASCCIIEQNKEQGTFTVVLTKTKSDKSFGLTIAGGVDKGFTPFVSSIKTGSLADRYGYFNINDRILEVNNTSILQLDHAEIIKTIQQHGNTLQLKTQFNTYEKDVCQWKKSSVLLKKENPHGFGIRITGGTSADGQLNRPVVVTDVSYHSNTGKMGVVFPGDHVEKINNHYVDKLEHRSVEEIFAATQNELILHYLYPVSSVCQRTSSNTYIVVEIQRPHEQCPIGIDINASFDYSSYGSNFIISNLIEGSLAARTGLLHIGDLIISINNTSLNGLSLSEAKKMLNNSPKLTYLQVLQTDANIQCYCGTSSNMLSNFPIENGSEIQTSSCGNTATELGYWNTSMPVSNKTNGIINTNTKSDRRQSPLCSMLSPLHFGNCRSVQSSIYSGRVMCPVIPKLPNGSLCSFMSHGYNFIPKSLSAKQETFTLELDSLLLPFEVHDGMASNKKCLTVVDIVTSKSRDNVRSLLQVGDRILSINNISTEDVYASELINFLQDVSLPLVMNVEFDVSDAVQPTKGSFSIKIHKNNGEAGITVANALSNDEEACIRILHIAKGSPAYRLGVLSPGDEIVSVNGECIRRTVPDDIHRMISNADDPVEMIIKKDEAIAGPTFCVVMTKNGENLGIAISGSEHPFQPVLISNISEDGLAFRCKAVEIGDNILAINDISLRGKTRSEACEILRNTGEKVKFLIKREASSKKSKDDLVKPQVRDDAFSSSVDKSSALDTSNTYSDSSDAKRESATHLRCLTDNSSFTIRQDKSCDMRTSPTSKVLPHREIFHIPVRVNKKNGTSVTDTSAVEVSSNESPGLISSHEENAANLESCRHALSDLSTSEHEVSAVTFRVGKKKSRFKRSLQYRRAKSIRKFLNVKHGAENSDHSQLLLQPFGVEKNRHSFKISNTSTEEECKISDGSHKNSDGSQIDQVQPVFQIERFRLPSLHKVSSIGNILTKRSADQENIVGDETNSSMNAHYVELFRNDPHEGYGFSVSDGVAEKGVFIRSIQAGSIADCCGNLLKYDRITQVNGQDTRHMTCDTVVPLLQASMKELKLHVERNPNHP